VQNVPCGGRSFSFFSSFHSNAKEGSLFFFSVENIYRSCASNEKKKMEEEAKKKCHTHCVDFELNDTIRFAARKGDQLDFRFRNISSVDHFKKVTNFLSEFILYVHTIVTLELKDYVNLEDRLLEAVKNMRERLSDHFTMHVHVDGLRAWKIYTQPEDEEDLADRYVSIDSRQFESVKDCVSNIYLLRKN